jgi:septal ring factor EnvC (AmiA/AmiB activator)
MGSSPANREPIHLQVKNIGNIEESSVTFLPGVNVLLGDSWLDNHSVMEAVTATYGNQNVTLRRGATEGYAKLTLGSESCTHHFARSDGEIVSDGDPCLDGLSLDDMFAFLLKSNNVRTSLVDSGDLNGVLQRATVPEVLWQEGKQLNQELDLAGRRVSSDSGPLEDLSEVAADADDIFSNVSGEYIVELARERAEAGGELQSHATKTEVRKFKELRKEYCRLDELESKIERAEETIEQLRADRQEVQSRMGELECVSEAETDRLDSKLGSLRERKSDRKSDLDLIQHIITCNEQILADDDSLSDVLGGVFSKLDHEPATNDTEACWACGCALEHTSAKQIHEAFKAEYDDRMTEYDAVVEELRETKQEFERKRADREKRLELRETLSDIEDGIESRQNHLRRLRDERQSVSDRIPAIESELTDIDRLVTAAMFDLPVGLGETASREQFDRLEDVVTRVDRTATGDSPHTRRESALRSERERLRERLEDAIEDHVRRFTRRMNELADVADDATVDGFDIEWEHNGYDHLPLLRQFDFDMYATVDGNGRNRLPVGELDPADRELAALLFVLAGYHVHDIREEIPVVLIDGFETAYPETVSAVVEYVTEDIPYIVVTPPRRSVESFQNVADNLTSV